MQEFFRKNVNPAHPVLQSCVMLEKYAALVFVESHNEHHSQDTLKNAQAAVFGTRRYRSLETSRNAARISLSAGAISL